MRYLQIRDLWLQEEVGNGTMHFEKIPRSVNTADTLTKHWTTESQAHFRRIGFHCAGSDDVTKLTGSQAQMGIACLRGRVSV